MVYAHQIQVIYPSEYVGFLSLAIPTKLDCEN